MSGALPTIIAIAILIAIVLVVVFFIKNALVLSDIKHHFRKGNTITFGYKGTGKDLLTHYFINKRGEHYYANMPYDKNQKLYTYIDLLSVSVAPNTYKSFVLSNIVVPTSPRLYEKEDIYYSDMGIYLPSQEDGLLHKQFPSLPITYALSRQLWNSNIHFNTQQLERGWKILREQADYFIWTRKTYHIFNLLITTGYTYEKYESAKQRLLPMKTSLFSKNELQKQYVATNGKIQHYFIIQKTKHIYYDTRHFEKVIYGDMPRKDRRKEEKENRKKKRLYNKSKKQLKKHLQKGSQK